MLLDGYWKLDLLRIRLSLCFWKGGIGGILADYAEHKINQGLLYSAAIIRKIVEDENDAGKITESVKMKMPPLPLLKTTVPVKYYQHVDPEKFFVNSKVFLADYDMKQEKEENMPLAYACNQIIHSYVWGIVYQKNRRIHGVLLASDHFMKEGIYLLAVKDWIDAIKTVIDNSNI